MKKNKSFSKPEAEIIQFHAEDVIATSNEWWEGGNDIGGGSGGNVPGTL